MSTTCMPWNRRNPELLSGATAGLTTARIAAENIESSSYPKPPPIFKEQDSKYISSRLIEAAAPVDAARTSATINRKARKSTDADRDLGSLQNSDSYSTNLFTSVNSLDRNIWQASGNSFGLTCSLAAQVILLRTFRSSCCRPYWKLPCVASSKIWRLC